ncbi:hypothetical protein FOL01_0908 [Weissella jogaejeotgali]|uniref:Glycosyltransferase n=1 Tax=Weissella jogaejeotgali TaxID=1631871 RepID=A0A1L6RB22_9LACO|nr:hypothetical protein [Weissella jogaejeotgali]APS41767.1 hypothetical protein FOL01_0908 [Weissella jogaejeotgali]
MSNKAIVFIVLVYGNYSDLERFNSSIPFQSNDFKVIVVDSFKDMKSTEEGEKIAHKIGADFIKVPNKGYGAGNNAGINYSQQFQYDYLFISNPDIEINNLSLNEIGDDEIVGPKVVTDSGKNQNPYYYKKEKIGFRLLKRYAYYDRSLWYYTYLISNKISKKVQSLYSKRKQGKLPVYALHGSFYGMKKETLHKLMPVFDERMFLYSEEDHIAELAKSKDVTMMYNTNWSVYHHEDGSGTVKNKAKNKLIRESLKVFFENWD